MVDNQGSAVLACHSLACAKRRSEETWRTVPMDTGHLTFPWPSVGERDLADWTGVSPSLRRLIERALAESARDRWPSAAAFGGALEKWNRDRALGLLDEDRPSGRPRVFRWLRSRFGR